jgi:hypothetical protein
VFAADLEVPTVTVTVTLRDGLTVGYMHAYVKHSYGALDVIRSGVKRPYCYAPAEWIDVHGDEKRWKSRLWG